MKEVQEPDTVSYRVFNESSVHPLRDEVCLIDTDPDVLIMPADDVISQLDKVGEDKILRVKGYNYNLEVLLTGNYLMADLFRNGTLVATYLSPRDYYRMHMSCSDILHEMIYVPGDLFSVNHLTAQNMLSPFARNERVIYLFDTEFGLVVQILAGTTIIGSTEMVQTGTITSSRKGIIKRWTWPAGENDDPAALLKGQEMGRFRLGSTAINLLVSGRVNLVEQLESLSVTKIDQSLVVSTETFVTLDAEPAPFPVEETEVEHDASPSVDDKKDQV